MPISHDVAVAIFTVGAFGVWGLAFWWAVRQPKYAWYYVWVLALLTVFWWLGESIAIRLGKYQYPDLYFRLPLPFGGTPMEPGALTTWLRNLLPADQPRPWDFHACVAKSWDIPVSVVAIEAALMFGIFRIAVRLLQNQRGMIRTALATAGLSGLLLVNVTATLDPVVSTTTWCAAHGDPGYHFLHVNLWEWYTTEAHPGYWYGVPLVNYAAWFLAAATFAFFARLDDYRPSGLIKHYKLIAAYVGASVLAIAFTFVALIFVKAGVDRVFEFGYSHRAHVNQKLWQFGVVGVVLGLGGLAIWLGRRHRVAHFEAVCFVPKFLVFLFCFALLLGEPYFGIFMILAVNVAIAVTVMLWTRFFPRAEEAPSNLPVAEARSRDQAVDVG